MSALVQRNVNMQRKIIELKAAAKAKRMDEANRIDPPVEAVVRREIAELRGYISANDNAKKKVTAAEIQTRNS